jgi:hypothetical protein
MEQMSLINFACEQAPPCGADDKRCVMNVVQTTYQSVRLAGRDRSSDVRQDHRTIRRLSLKALSS